MEEQETIHRSIWDFFKVKCPKCKSTSIKEYNLHKQIYKFTGKKYIRKEVSKYKCKVCKHIFWV